MMYEKVSGLFTGCCGWWTNTESALKKKLTHKLGQYSCRLGPKSCVLPTIDSGNLFWMDVMRLPNHLYTSK